MKTEHVDLVEELCSYDVTMLFTSFSMGKVVVCIRRKLEADDTLQE